MRTAVIAAAGLLLVLTVLMSARVEARPAAKVASTGQKVAHGKTRKPVRRVPAKRHATKPGAPEMLLAEPQPLEAGESGLHGVASFYGYGFQGRKVASGERFDVRKMTAASNRFALGTWLAVRRLDNDLCVIVRVNDRMHAKHRVRIIDLSRGAAERLNMISAGLVLVQARPLAAAPTGDTDAACRAAFKPVAAEANIEANFESNVGGEEENSAPVRPLETPRQEERPPENKATLREDGDSDHP